MAIEVDPLGRTFLYIMYVESVKLMPEMRELTGTEVVCRWYIDQENDCSRPFALSLESPATARYCSFMVLSFDDPSQRNRSVTMTLSQPDGSEHLCVAFLDLANFSSEDVFKIENVELKNQAGVVAVADLHTAAQTRWQQGQLVEPRLEGYFANPSTDPQAERLYLHIMQEAPPSEASGAEAVAAAAAAAAEAEQQQALAAKQAAEAAEAEQRRQAAQAAEAAEAERQRLVAEAASEQQRQAALEAEQRRAAEEKQQQEEAAKKREEEQAQFLRQKMMQEEEEERERARQDEETRALKERQLKEELAEQERQKKHEEDLNREKSRRDIEAREAEREAERLRREEEDRILERRRQQRDEDNRARADDLSRSRQGRAEEHERDREEDARDSGTLYESERLRRLREREWEEAEFERRRKEDQERRDMQRLRERRQWEEDRERLRQDARREQERERAERERRAEERRRQVEALAKARLGTDSGYEVMRKRNTGQDSRGAGRVASTGASQPRKAEPPGNRPSRSSEREVVATEALWTGRSSHDSGYVDHSSRASNICPTTNEERGDSRSAASETDDVKGAAVVHHSSARAGNGEGRVPRSQKGGSRTSASAGFDVNECSTINTGRSHHSSTVVEDSRQRMAVMHEVESDSERSLNFEEEAADAMLEHQQRDEMDYPAEHEFAAPGHGCQQWPRQVPANDSRGTRAATKSASEVASSMLELRKPTQHSGRVCARSAPHGPGPASMSLRLEQLKSMPGGHARHSPSRCLINSGGEELDDAASSILNINTSMTDDALQSTPRALGESRGNSVKDRAAGRAGRAAGRGSSMRVAGPREVEGVDAAVSAWGGRHERRRGGTQRRARGSVPLSHAPLQSQHASQANSDTGMPGMVAPTSGASVGANGIVAAALADAAVGGVNGLTTLPVAAVEECVLRLLVLQRELSGSEEPGRSALLDAAAGLAPRMLQVLEAARSVCVTNRAKLRTFCEERHLNLDTLGNAGSEYMTPQLSALEKLHGQYASLLPVAPASTHMAGYSTANLTLDVAGHTSMGYPAQSVVHPAPWPTSPTTVHDTLTLGPQQRHIASTQQQQQQQLIGPTGQLPVSAVTFHTPGYVMDEPSGVRLGNALARHTPPSPLMDPGGLGPPLPMLRSGGSTPPQAKFRQQQQQPCIALSATQRLPANTHHGAPPWQSTERADGNCMWKVSAKGIAGGESNLHRERDDWGLPLSARSRSSSNTARQPPTATQLSRGSSPLPESSKCASTVASSHGVMAMKDKNTHSYASVSPRAQQTGAALLATAVEDLMDRDFQQVHPRVAFATPFTELKGDITAHRQGRRGPASKRSSAGTTGSPSPDHYVPKGHVAANLAQARDAMPVPAEDKYLKILRSLQAKGAAGVPGGGNNAGTSSLAAQLLEGARRNRMLLTPKPSTPTKASRGLVNDSDSDSDSSSSGSSRRWSRQRRAVTSQH